MIEWRLWEQDDGQDVSEEVSGKAGVDNGLVTFGWVGGALSKHDWRRADEPEEV